MAENITTLGNVDLEMVPELTSLAVCLYSGSSRAALHLRRPSEQSQNPRSKVVLNETATARCDSLRR